MHSVRLPRRAMDRQIYWLVCALCVVYAARCSPVNSDRQRINPTPDPDPAEAVAVFDSAWSRIARSHYDSTFNGLDWRGVRAELRPQAERAQNTRVLRSVIRQLLARLGESHYVLIPQEFADAVDPQSVRAATSASERPGDLGMEVRLVGDDVMVSLVESGGPAELAGIHAGWIVDAIDRQLLGHMVGALQRLDTAERRTGLTRFLWSANAMLDGAAGSKVELLLRDGQDRSVRLLLTRRMEPGEPVRLGNLPTFLAHLSSSRLEANGGCVGVIRFNVWMTPLVREFDRAIDGMRNCGGIVVDLRGNPGGVAGMLMGIAGHFLDRPVALGIMKSRAGELKFVANPRRASASGAAVEPFAGSVAVLVDAMTASTSEFFAGGMQAIGRAKVFGERTAGQALPAAVSRLPNHDVLMYVVADYTDPKGRRFERGGVVPDSLVPLSRRDLLAGRDRALETALDWITSEAHWYRGSR